MMKVLYGIITLGELSIEEYIFNKLPALIFHLIIQSNFLGLWGRSICRPF
jgi:hypothetical protein